MRLLLLCIVSTSLLNLAGCNLLGITPQQRRPSPTAKITAKPSESETAFQELQKQLIARIDKLEAQIQLNQLYYQKRLKNMDQTISLLEGNIVVLKKNLRKLLQKLRLEPKKKQKLMQRKKKK